MEPVSLLVYLAVLSVLSPLLSGLSSSHQGQFFLCQQRLGRGAKPFKMFKFRTMEVNVETRSHELHLQHLISTDCPMDEVGRSR
jgi:lipopolysaccharide/colanic/teichoic acid biosynthesis glycosyltransferase